MIWDYISKKKAVGKLVKIDRRMTSVDYYNILKNNVLQSVENMYLGSFVFQKDNDPKHTSKVASKCFTEKQKLKNSNGPHSHQILISGIR